LNQLGSKLFGLLIVRFTIIYFLLV
jgi:hypothetical protein